MRISDWSSDVCSSDLTLDGLGTLASAARARSHARVAAVTGSVGKTGVKEALLLVLAQQAQAHASAGNQVGRASCRARVVAVRVDLGCRRLIQTKSTHVIQPHKQHSLRTTEQNR